LIPEEDHLNGKKREKNMETEPIPFHEDKETPTTAGI